MIVLGVIIGLLVAILTLVTLSYFQQAPEVAAQLRKLLPQPKGAILKLRTQTEIERDQRREQAKKDGDTISIEDDLL